MQISYDRNEMDLAVEFLRNANPSAECLTPDELRDEIEKDMRRAIENGSRSVSRYGYRLTRDDIYGVNGFDITVNLSVGLRPVLVDVYREV